DNQDLEGSLDAKQIFALDVLQGLSELPKRLSSRYFYDEEGSRLFQEITSLPEYYLTACEYEIFKNNRGKLADMIEGKRVNLIELGPGDGHKSLLLIEHLLDRGINFEYVPIDISEPAMRDLTDDLSRKLPELKVHGIVSEYFDGLKWLNRMKNS